MFVIRQEYEGVVVYLTDEGVEGCEVWSTDVREAWPFPARVMARMVREMVGEGEVVEL